MAVRVPSSIISIQSHVSYGHVGNASAVFPLQRLGFEVWPLMTVQFSNHTGYGAWTGQIFTAQHITELLEGMTARGALDGCSAVLSGYMGDAALGRSILDAQAEVKRRNPGALYCCDPVMGDVGRGIFVRPGIPEFMAQHAVPAADIITPNQFELELLTGMTVTSLEDALAATRKVMAMGPKVVLVTSLRHSATPEGRIEMLAATADEAWISSTPLLPLNPAPNGAGDALAALFLGHILRGAGIATALSRATAGIFAIIEATHAAGTRELQLVAAQDRFAGDAAVEVRPAG